MSEKPSKRQDDFDDITVTPTDTPPAASIDGEGHVDGTGQRVTHVAGGKESADVPSAESRVHYEEAEVVQPRTWYGRMWKVFKTPGSALQMYVELSVIKTSGRWADGSASSVRLLRLRSVWR